ncbi:MAG: TonB-dependent receptor [Proteobacteria bacterium]|nr:TonB-dependent receptor [Pseudomonadota bacterium]
MKKTFGVQILFWLLASVLAVSSLHVQAQVTSSGMSGRVLDAQGNPVAGAKVRIVHVPSGTASTATTDANGRYVAQGLREGGPYHVEAKGAGIKEIDVDNVFLRLAEAATVNLTEAAPKLLEGIVVTANAGTAAIFNSDNKGLGTNISGRALETAVSGNRSLDDIARLDPRITVTDQNDGSISVAGQNNRYNNISVDGLSVTDPFGLNANGLGFTGSPISPDTIAAYDISASDYDTAHDTVGANINAVTKSGTNDFHGSVYYAFNNAKDMVGDRGGASYDGFDQNKTAGFTLGGPIVKDTLFFFVGYEDQKITGIKGVGTDAVSSGLITQSQVDAVLSAASAIGMKPGSNVGGGVGLEDKRSLAKLDWNISDGQRASFTYQQTKEARPTPYGAYVRSNSVVTSSDWYNIANKTDNYSFQLFSDWTDNFSTELKIGYQKYANTNGATLNQPEVDVVVPGANPVTIYMGEDQYRHENSIGSKRFTGTFAGTYHAGDHDIRGGFDFLSNKVSDVFGRQLHGLYTFTDKNGDGSVLDELAAGNYATFSKTIIPNGVSLADIAGTWKYTQVSPFLQDTWQVTPNFSLVYGLRVDIPDANHAPPVAIDPATGQSYWQERFGYAPNGTLNSGDKVIEPRVAFNYTFDSERKTQLRGGVGLFQTVPPYVWLTNPYLNNGVASLKNYSSTNPTTDPFSADPYNQPGLQSANVQTGICTSKANCQIDTLAPGFKLPGALKFSLAFDRELPWWGLIGSAEYMFIQNQNAIVYLAPNIGKPNGTLPDGRFSYWKTFPDSGTSTIGTGTNFGAYPEIYYRSTELANTNEGDTNSLTLSLTKPMQYGFSGVFSTTFTHSTEVNPGTSSQAWSNYNYLPRVNANDVAVAPSRFDIPVSIKAALNWEHIFFGNNRTTVSAYFNAHSGQPYSWIFGNDVNGDSLANTDLAYIPLKDDPIVSYGSATQAQIDAFQSFIDSDPYLRSHRGRIATRNSSHQPWVHQLDVGLQQELPGFFGKDHFIVRMDIFNFLNLLNKNWGNQEGLGFYATRRLANVSDVANGKYVYNLGTPTAPSWQNFGVYDTYTNPARVISRWQILLTLKYAF